MFLYFACILHLRKGFHKLKSLIILIFQANLLKHLPFLWAHSLLLGVVYGLKNHIEDSYIKELIWLRSKFKSFSVFTSIYKIFYMFWGSYQQVITEVIFFSNYIILNLLQIQLDLTMSILSALSYSWCLAIFYLI